MLGWEQPCLNVPSKMESCTLVPSSPTSYPLMKKNYDVGSEDILEIKLALEELRQWLEGSIHHIHNLDRSQKSFISAVIQGTQCSSGSLVISFFFSRFQFTITVHTNLVLGSSISDESKMSKNILPSLCTISKLTRDI